MAAVKMRCCRLPRLIKCTVEAAQLRGFMALFCCEVRACRAVGACLSSNCSKEIYLALRWCVYGTVDHRNWAKMAVWCQPPAKWPTCLLVCRCNHLIFLSSHFRGNQHLSRNPLFQIHRNSSSIGIRGMKQPPTLPPH